MTTPDSNEVRKVAELLRGNRTAMLTTVADDGTLTSRPMAVQEVEFDGDLWFFASQHSRKITHLTTHPDVNVTVGSASTWVSLDGHASIVTDLETKKKYWNPVVEAWFPDGPDDSDIVLLKIEASSAQYWDTPGGRVASLISFAKAKATGKPYSGGDSGTVSL